MIPPWSAAWVHQTEMRQAKAHLATICYIYGTLCINGGTLPRRTA